MVLMVVMPILALPRTIAQPAPLSKHVVKVLFRGETVETWYINGRCRFYVRISSMLWGVDVCRIPGTVVDGIFHPGLVEDSRFGIQGPQTHKTRANVHLVDVHRGCRGSCVGWRRRAERTHNTT